MKTGNNGGSGVLTYLQVKAECRVFELLQFVLAPDCRTRRIRFNMADKDIILEKFSGHTATDWTDWLEDYICYADMKKWNETKQVQNLRFFVSGDIRDCVRATTNELKVVSDAVQALLGGEPTSLIASQAIDNIKYSGNILVMVQEMRRWGKYVTSTAEVDKFVLLQLQRQLPLSYAEKVIEKDCKTLDEAIKVVQGLERAHKVRTSRGVPAELQVGRISEERHPAPPSSGGQQPQYTFRPAAPAGGQRRKPRVQQPTPQQARSPAGGSQARYKGLRCYCCGGPGHVRRNCAFKSDMCGTCGVKGHLSPVCRNQGNEGRPTTRPSQ